MEWAEDLFQVSLKGSGPYGFRLYGGDGDPLIVAKLRAKSKAHDAGLREGDVILGINGRSCQSISHGIAMALLETAQEFIRLHLYRGNTDRKSIAAAYSAVGNQLRPVSPGTAPPNRSIFAIQPSPGPEVEPSVAPPVEVPVPPVTLEGAGRTGAEPSTSYSIQIEGGLTQKTTSETQDLGGVTVTKVTRETVKEQRSGATWAPKGESDKVQRSAVFHVPKFKAEPLRWMPEAPATPGNFLVNKSITVEVAEKENLAPSKNRELGREFGEFVKVHEEPPKFKVYKTTAKRSVWQPGNVPGLPVRETSPPLTFQVLETQDFPLQHNLEQESSKGHVNEKENWDNDDSLGLNPHLMQILTTEGTPDDYSFGRKKKIFADSAFYDDPEQKYPTIEEQIKMARKVAISLSASDNVTARGQRMFLKRKMKADNWSTDQSLDGLNPYITAPKSEARLIKKIEQQTLYYNPTPWSTPRTNTVERVVPGAITEPVEGYSEDPEASSAAFAKNRALFEKSQPRGQVLPWKKSQLHDGLMRDLKGMKGKGAKLFAQRRAKAVEEEAEWQSEGEGRGLVRASEKRKERKLVTPEPTDSQDASARRLEELIATSKAHLSPWESKAPNKAVLTPWQPTTPATAAAAGGQTKKGTSDDLSRQPTTNDIPNFIAKKAPSGSYRPVKFLLTAGGPGPGISDF